MQFKKLKRKLKHSTKGISPVLAVLMMIVVAIAAGLVLYGWVMGYLDFSTSNVGKAIKIQSIGHDGSNLIVYVQNVGDGSFNLTKATCLFIDGLIKPVEFVPAPVPSDSMEISLDYGDISGLSLSITPAELDLLPDPLNVKVVTNDGTFNEATWTK